MEDIRDLKLTVELGETHHLMSLYEQRRDFIFSTIWNTFDEAERNETITNRIITVSTEIILLQNVLKNFVDKNEYDDKLKSLNDELETLTTLRVKTNMNNDLRKGTDINEYERVFNGLNQLFN